MLQADSLAENITIDTKNNVVNYGCNRDMFVYMWLLFGTISK